MSVSTVAVVGSGVSEAQWDWVDIATSHTAAEIIFTLWSLAGIKLIHRVDYISSITCQYLLSFYTSTKSYCLVTTVQQTCIHHATKNRHGPKCAVSNEQFCMTTTFPWHFPDSGPPSFAPLTPTSSLFWEQTLDLATGVSRLRVREFGTVYPPHCSSLTLNLDTLNDF